MGLCFCLCGCGLLPEKAWESVRADFDGTVWRNALSCGWMERSCSCGLPAQAKNKGWGRKA